MVNSAVSCKGVQGSQSLYRGRKKKSTTAIRILRNNATDGTDDQENPNFSELPNGTIYIKFTNDYNILQIDKVVLAKFEREKQDKTILEDELALLLQRRSEPLTIGESRILDTKISEHKSKIAAIVEGLNKSSYQERTKDLLDKYRGYLTSSHITRVEYDPERVLTIVNYLDIAKEYLSIDYVHLIQPPTSIICKGCHIPIDPQKLRDNDTHCPNCGLTRSIINQNRISEAVEGGTKEYSDEKNFIKAFTRYQGLQKLTFKIEEVCALIDGYLQSEGYKPASYYRELPADIYGKKKGTSIDMIEEALEAIGRTHLYESTNLIGHHLWGWTLFDLQHLKEGLISDYRETQEVFEALPPEVKDRESSLSTQLRLFRGLQLKGHPCRPCDFKLPIQSESLRKQDALWKIMCDTVNRKNPSIYYIPM